MSSINPSALVAAQVYSTASQPHRHAAPARERPKTDETPKFQVEDKVEARKAERPEPSRTEAASQPEQRSSAPARPKRPGTLVDIKA